MGALGAFEWRRNPSRRPRQAGAEFSLDTAALLAQEEHGVSIAGRSPWYLAWRRLRRNYARARLARGVPADRRSRAALAPVYAKHVAHTDAATNHITEQVKVGGKVK